MEDTFIANGHHHERNFLRHYEGYDFMTEKTSGPVYNHEVLEVINPPNSVIKSIRIDDKTNGLNIAIEEAKAFVNRRINKFPSNNKINVMTLQLVPIDKVYPSKDNYRSEFDEIGINDLAVSIKEHNILQPLLLRANGKPGHYEIVCGERRYRAAIIAGLKELPANIRELTDDQAFEMRITENLQRKDVHPMDEALAFKKYQERNNISLDELSAKFGKSKEYIAQRLSFNALIPDMQKDFYAGKMLIGHAIQFARLTVDDQKQALRECKSSWGNDKGMYRSMEDVKEWIADEVMHNLNEAAFNKKDENLVPKVGSCTNCPKRSGGNVLFADIKQDDRCFDGKCFAAKKLAHTLLRIEELVLTEPAMPVVRNHSSDDIIPEISKVLKENKITVLNGYDDFEEANKKDKMSTMALVIAGIQTGKVIGIKLKSTPKAKAAKIASVEADNDAVSVEQIDEQISGIKERMKRSSELDDDKVHVKITDRLVDLKPYLEPDKTTLIPEEYTALIFMAYQKLDHDSREKIRTLLKLKSTNNYWADEKTVVEKLHDASEPLRCFIIRCAIKDAFISKSILSRDPKAILVRKIADKYPGVPVAEYVKEQEEIKLKRETSAKNRIADLQAKKKDLKKK